MSNKIRKLCENRKLLVGSSISTSDPMISEALAYSGVDLLWIDTEHTPLSKNSVFMHMAVTQGAGVPVLARVAYNDPVLTKPLLDMGVDGIIFPMVSNAEEALRAVSSMTYPPHGIRGYGPLRANRYGEVSDYFLTARDNILCFVQIETSEGVDNIEEICAVPGIDGVLYGGMDLSASLGSFGYIDSPQCLNAIAHVSTAAKKEGLLLGCCAPDDDKSIEIYMNAGVDIYLASGDLAMLCAYAKKMTVKIRSMAENCG